MGARMLALALVLDGVDRKTAAETCGMDRQTLRDWVHRYNAEGLAVPPFSARRGAVRFDVRGVDHLRVCGSPVRGKLPEQIFPDAAPRPTHETVINRRRWAIFRRTIAPATAAFQHVHDATDDTAIVRPLDPSYVRRQVRCNPIPLLIAQPK
jgi:hypothetical protein